MQQVMAANPKIVSGRGNNILYLPTGAGNAASAPVPVSQLPGVKTSPTTPEPAAEAPSPRPERPAGREGTR